MRIAVGILVISGVAFSMPAKTNNDDSPDPDAPVKSKPGKLSHLFMFHKNKKETEAKSEPAEQVDTRRHTNGFPEGDKKDVKYQPQHADDTWMSDNWKTSRNKDTFKQTDVK